jgi:hypothetical protein
MTTNIHKYSQMLTYIHKYSQMLTKVFRWYRYRYWWVYAGGAEV